MLCAPKRSRTDCTTAEPKYDSTKADVFSMLIIQFCRSLFVINSPFRP
nr:MAG TPA: hypothetical protein [Caudoviricetes sp.]DAT51883.1 MAG TPA: hypothetical protein [Caudoviricetes sp.]